MKPGRRERENRKGDNADDDCEIDRSHFTKFRDDRAGECALNNRHPEAIGTHGESNQEWCPARHLCGVERPDARIGMIGELDQEQCTEHD